MPTTRQQAGRVLRRQRTYCRHFETFRALLVNTSTMAGATAATPPDPYARSADQSSDAKMMACSRSSTRLPPTGRRMQSRRVALVPLPPLARTWLVPAHSEWRRLPASGRQQRRIAVQSRPFDSASVGLPLVNVHRLFAASPDSTDSSSSHFGIRHSARNRPAADLRAQIGRLRKWRLGGKRRAVHTAHQQDDDRNCSDNWFLWPHGDGSTGFLQSNGFAMDQR
jgi:hypothetical protein